MTDDERAHWANVQREVSQALLIAKKLLPEASTGAEIQQMTGTVLNHHRELKREAYIHAAGNGATPAAAPTAPGVVCPECGGAMGPNPKPGPKKPTWVCLQQVKPCGKAGTKGGFFPTGKWND